MNSYGLVLVTDACPGVRVDLRYTRADHFFGRPLYAPSARAWLLAETAHKLSDAAAVLGSAGFGLVVLDAYRPLSVQALMWDAVPDESFVAPPSRGSIHNRGAAVDVTLLDANGKEVPMPSAFDEFSPRASHAYADGPADALRCRDTLRAAMEASGFRAYEAEWWHYADPENRSAPLLSVDFDELAASLLKLPPR